MKSRVLVWLVAGGLVVVAGCAQPNENPHSSSFIVSKMDLEAMQPSVREEVRNKSVHVDPEHANARVPYFVDALRKASQGETQGIADRGKQDAVIDYLREISGGRYLPPIEFEGSYFQVERLTE